MKWIFFITMYIKKAPTKIAGKLPIVAKVCLWQSHFFINSIPRISSAQAIDFSIKPSFCTLTP